ncbi:response regulator transcription factor [Aestuariibacter halophilus]|uniref:Response regulator transcription factor n=1 Tax=Fluctibacter halophilus TaxID=226011 RepID=A0ABS8G9U0_9ALTE|nr:response regulator transcription factor [Aestuariibacter halophilus]MCC2617209.1 response regulator transcription factor [Aestuariibacter halophilus]
MNDTVLVVEDDGDIAELIRVNLMELGADIQVVHDGAKGLQLAREQHVALVILDVMLPGMSGLDVCRTLRHEKPEQAILMLTAKNTEMDRVLGLEIGADDYMTKPFSVRELQARVRSQLRKYRLLKERHQDSVDARPTVISVGRLQVDPGCHTALLGSQTLDLTATEFELLLYLASHPNQVFSRAQLLESVWGYHHSGYEHTVNSHINRLRAKLEKDARQPDMVQTVWGVGYKFNPEGALA